MLFALGLLLFFAVHSLVFIAPQLKPKLVGRLGAAGWKGSYALIALLGLALMVLGYGQLQALSPVLYHPPLWLRPLVSLMMLASMIALVASLIPSAIGQRLKHPQLNAVKFWALAHLLASGKLVALVLFVLFLIWAVLLRIHYKRSGKSAAEKRTFGRNDYLVLVLGFGLYGAWVFFLHAWLIGVPLH